MALQATMRLGLKGLFALLGDAQNFAGPTADAGHTAAPQTRQCASMLQAFTEKLNSIAQTLRKTLTYD